MTLPYNGVWQQSDKLRPAHPFVLPMPSVPLPVLGQEQSVKSQKAGLLAGLYLYFVCISARAMI